MKLKRVLKWIAARDSSSRSLALGHVHRLLDDRLTNAIATPFPSHPMKAILHCEYGGPEVLKVEEIEKPVPNDDQVLVRVRAASVNPLDLTIRGMLALAPAVRNAQTKRHAAGRRLCGTVEAVGKNVTLFKPGDEVFGAKERRHGRVRLCSSGSSRRVETGEHDV